MVSGQNLIVGWDQALIQFVDLAAFYVLIVPCKPSRKPHLTF
jgi:hypothetical protein